MESSQKPNLINDHNLSSKIDLLNGDIYNDHLVVTNEMLIKNDKNNEKTSLKKDKENSGKISSRNKPKSKKNIDIYSLNESFSELSLSDKRKIKKNKKVKEERYIVDNIDNILSVLKEPKLKLVIQEYLLYAIIFLISIYYWIFLFLTTVRFEQAYCYTSDNQFDACTDDDICNDLNIVLFNHTFNYHNHQLNSLHKVLVEESNIINTYYKPFFLRYNYLLIKNKTFSNYDLTSITDKINFGIMITHKEKWNLFLRFFSYCQYESYYILIIIMIGVGGIIGSFVFGLLSDIYGRRTIIRITLFIITLSTIGIFLISLFLDCYYDYILNNFNNQYIISKDHPSYSNILSHLFAQNKVKEKFNKLFIFFLLFTFLLNLGMWPLSKSCLSLLVENTKSDLYALINFRKAIFAIEGLSPFFASIIFSIVNDFTITFFILSICYLLIFIYSLIFFEESIRYYYEYCEWKNLTATILNTYNNDINDFKTLNKFELKQFQRKENLKHFNLNNNLRKRRLLNKDKKMNKLISIIMPVKNGEKYLAAALEGILAQNMNVEIILVDDASTDNTAQIAENYGCKVVKQPVSKGQVAAKNIGLQAADGEYIMFHDGDDVMNKGSLKQLYEYMEAHSQVYMAMAKVQDFISPDAVNQSVAPKTEPYWGLFTGAVLMRKSLFERVGLFDEKVHAGEIIELQQKMQVQNLKLQKLDFVAAMRRIHDSNFGRTAAKTEYQNYAAILRKKLRK